RRVPISYRFLGAAAAVAVAFLLVPKQSSTDAVVYIGLGFAELGAVAVGLRRYRPAQPASWVLLLVGVGLYSLANAVQFGWPLLLGGPSRFPRSPTRCSSPPTCSSSPASRC